MNIIYILFITGIIVESMSGALSAGRTQMDFFGVIVIALITGLGGGTVRDVLIGNYPLLWVKEPMYILISVAAATVTIFAASHIHKRYKIFLMLDAMGLAAFSIVATERGLDLGLHPIIITIIAIITGTAGGMMRDILCNDVPLVFRKELYAVVALVASCVFQLINLFDVDHYVVEFLTFIIAFALRMAAIKWKLMLPNFDYSPDK